jgi:site-specific recombinase XerD
MEPVDRRMLKAMLTQVAVESLGIDPRVASQGSHHLPAAGSITISAEQLVGLMDKLLDILSAVLAEAGYADGNEGGEEEWPQVLLSQAIEQLILATQAEGRAEATLKDYRKKLSQFLDFAGDRCVSDVLASDIRSFLVSLYDRGLSKPYVAGFVRAIRRLFNWCEGEGFIVDNPMQRIKTPELGDPEPKCIEWEDFERLLETTREDTVADRRDAAILIALYDIGCRVSALCGLRCCDLDLAKGLVRVREKKVKKARWKPISRPTREAIEAWLEVRPEVETDALFVSLSTNFRSIKGEGLKVTSIGQMLKRRARQAGVTGRVNPHSFRHAFGRDYILNGGDLATGAELMGNSVGVMTKHYARFRVKELQEKHAKHSPIACRFEGARGGQND